MLKVFGIKLGVNNEVLKFDLLSNEIKFDNYYKKFNFKKYHEIILKNKERIGVDILFGKQIQSCLHTKLDKYTIPRTDKVNGRIHLEDAVLCCEENGYYSELHAGFLGYDNDDNKIYSFINEKKRKLTIDPDFYELKTKKELYSKFTLPSFETTAKPCFTVGNPIINNKHNDYYFFKSGPSGSLTFPLTTDLNYPFVRYFKHGNTDPDHLSDYVDVLALSSMIWRYRDSRASYVNHQPKFEIYNAWGISGREAYSAYLVDYDKKENIKDALFDDPTYNDFTTEYPEEHIRIIDSESGIMDFSSSSFAKEEILNYKGYGNSLERGKGGWNKFFEDTSPSYGKLNTSLHKILKPEEGIFTGDLVTYHYDGDTSTVDSVTSLYSKINLLEQIRDAVKKTSTSSNYISVYAREIIDSMKIPAYHSTQNINDSDYDYYLFLKDTDVIEHIYHHSIKFLINDNNNINNTLDDDRLYYDFEHLNLSTNKAKIFSRECSEVDNETYKTIIKALVTDRKGTEPNNKTKFKDYYSNEIETIKSTLKIKYNNPENDTNGGIIELRNAIFRTTDNFFESLVVYNDEIKKMFPKIKDGGVFENIMAEYKTLISNTNSDSKINILYIDESTTNDKIKILLNHCYVGHNNELLFVMKENSDKIEYWLQIIKNNNVDNNYEQVLNYILKGEAIKGKIDYGSFDESTEQRNEIDEILNNYLNGLKDGINFNISNKINIYSSKKLDIKDDPSSIPTRNGFYIDNFFQFTDSDNSNSNLDGKIICINFSDEFEIENTITGIELTDNVIEINKDNFPYFYKKEQNEIKYSSIYNSVDSLKFSFDLTKILSDFNKDNIKIVVFVNNFSNSGNTYLNETISGENNHILNLSLEDKNILIQGINTISIILYSNGGKIAYQEFYFSLEQKSIEIKSFSAKMLSKGVSSQYNQNKFNVILELKDDEPDIVYNDNDYYSIYIKNSSDEEFLIKDKIETKGKFYTENFDFMNIFELKRLDEQTSHSLYSNWEAIIKRRNNIGKRVIRKTVFDSNPEINNYDFRVGLYSKLTEEQESIMVLTDGYLKLSLSASNNYTDIDEIFKTLNKIEVLAGLISLKKIEGPELNYLSFSECKIGEDLIFNFYGTTENPDTNYLEFINNGERFRDIKLTIELTFNGGKKISLLTNELLGVEYQLKIPSLEDTDYNRKKKIESENRDIFVSYSNIVDFKMDNVDIKTTSYEVYQNANEQYKERPINSKKKFINIYNN